MPAGGKEDGKNYLEFLKQVKGLLPPGKTLSIAAPASYWYLKGFLIQQMVSDHLESFMHFDCDPSRKLASNSF